MKERPILMNAAMVRATLDGTKTQTRRVVKGRAFDWLQPGMFTPEYVALPDSFLSPYGFSGDRLWVRESFWGCDMPGWGDQPCVVYEDEWHGKEYLAAEVRPYARRFGHIPAIHMPRDASRILLEVTGVRIEKLRDISEADAIAEGSTDLLNPIGWYAELWDSLKPAAGFTWADNPWVWVVEFKKVGA